jgi:hypothetical protein
MSRGLSAGHAFTEALHMVAESEPISMEFRKTYEERNRIVVETGIGKPCPARAAA